MSTQKIVFANGNYKELDSIVREVSVKRLLLVCDRSIKYLKLNDYFVTLRERFDIEITVFSDFKPNPTYDSVVSGIEAFKKENCEAIIVVGGGSAIDVAKCIKLFSNMNSKINYLEQPIKANEIPLIAIPTTAGTGSESTRFAVIYYNNEKQSITDCSCIPQYVLLDSTVLSSLPSYQKKSSMLDALCHAIESFWSINSTDESKKYSFDAIKLILENKDGYLNNEKEGNRNMLLASNIAGKAINITQTTAAHAMSYKITSLYGCAHGHAVAICLPHIWRYILNNLEKCTDLRGATYLSETLDEIAKAMGSNSKIASVEKFETILNALDIIAPKMENVSEIDILTKSVNLVRLKNNPVLLDEDALRVSFQKMFGI